MANRPNSQPRSRTKTGHDGSTPARSGATGPHQGAASGVKGERPTSSPLGTKASDEVKRPTGVSHVQPRRAERRPEMIRQRRDERLKAYERQRRMWLLTRIGLAAFGLLVLVAVGFAAFNYIQDRRLNRVPENTRTFEYAGGDHTTTQGETVAYAETPPVGGKHDPTWQNCGYYAAPIRSEHGVHSMEHGAIWITYRPDLPQDQVDRLKQRAEDQDYLLVSPFPEMPAGVNIVASAWNRQVQLDSVDDERLDQFIRRFRRSPEAPEPRGVCTGGTTATR